MRQRSLIVLFGAALTCIVAGCSSTAPTPAPTTTPRASDVVDGSAIAALRARAGRPASPRSTPPPAPDMLASMGVEPGEVDGTAIEPLAEVIGWASAWVDDIDEPADAVGPEDRVAALKEYAAGRAMIIAGDATGAEAALEEATWLDPNAGPAWISLGRAKLALGKRSEALQALEEAVGLGELDPTALDALARAAIESGEWVQAIEYLAAALRDPEAVSDPGLLCVLYVDLSAALERSGRLLAGIEALDLGLELPGPGAMTTQGQEIEAIRRRAPALLMSAGDAAIRIGRFDLASRAYARATAELGAETEEMIARRVYAAVAEGADPDGALAVLDHIVVRGGVASNTDRRLIRYLTNHARLGDSLGAAMGEIRAWAGDDSRTIAVDLALAQSEAFSPTAARRLLAETIRTYGATGPLITQMLRTHTTAPGLVDQASSLIAIAPLEGDAVVARLFRVGAAPSDLIEVIEADEDALLLKGWLRLAQNDPAGALTAIDDLDESSREAPGARLLRVRALGMDGRWTEVDAEIDALYEASDLESRRALVRALYSVQRFSDAAAIAGILADRDEASNLDLFNAARLAVDMGDERAVEWLERALERDPHDESCREQLITFALETGRQALATSNMRSVRELRPEGRLVRWITATQMLQRGFSARAEPTLMTLLEEEPGDSRSFDALMGVWIEKAPNTGVVGERDWLTEQTANRPLDVWLVAGLARLLAAVGQGEEAVSLLASAYEENPAPIIAWHREEMLRTLLQRPTEADALSLARLGAGPRGVDATLDLITILLEQGAFGEASEAMAVHLPPVFELTREQSRATAEAIGRGVADVSTLRGALDALQTLGSRARPLRADMMLVWLAVLRENVGTGPAGDVSDALAFINASSEQGALEVLNALSRQGQPLGVDEPASALAELSYVLGGLFLDEDRGDALDLYRAALRFDPSHAFAANDLGYFLLERGSADLDEIDVLMTTALAGEPDSASVLDSVGWLRYHQGRLQDEVGPSGEIINRGAISLLRAALDIRAAEMAALGLEERTLEIRSHLGDALWRSGDEAGAVAEWRTALQIAESFVRRGSGRRDPAMVEEVGEHAREFNERIRDASAGREPPIAPMIGEAEN